MATWIAHLRIAENLLDLIPDLNAAQFAIGNIAPDSGIPDENWEKFEPPPEVTHFKRNRSVHKDIADLDFYRGYLADLSSKEALPFSFRLGYFFHLITDNLWTVEVGKPTQKRFAKEFAEDERFIWEVKKDWYGLDLIYVRDHPESLFWRTFLNAEPKSCDLDFLPMAAINRHLKYIKTFYQRQDEEIQEAYRRPFIYLSQAEMDKFVEQVTQRLYRIYQALWVEKTPVPNEKSILSTIA
ncbi:MAG: hypothetical protein B5M51_04510 [Anaerolinea sp. 4484_236]|nr:MAG: hypothetical protein B5M51_04510 [Anaerolinea sp. 4484_236]